MWIGSLIAKSIFIRFEFLFFLNPVKRIQKLETCLYKMFHVKSQLFTQCLRV